MKHDRGYAHGGALSSVLNPDIPQAISANFNHALDLHLGNLLLQFPSPIDGLSVE